MSTSLSEPERFPELFVNTNIDRRQCRRVVPLKVIVLGMPRTGTQSIRVALKRLGFEDTYHMDCLFENPPDIDLWHQAFMAKFRGQGKLFEKEDWDQLLGHCQAVCDLPTSAFIPELLACYPDAKVILTPRDTDSWYVSCQRTIHTAATSPSIRVRSLFLFQSVLSRPPTSTQPINLSTPSNSQANNPLSQILAALDTHFLSRFVPLLGLMFASLFPCPPSLWALPEGREIWIDHYNRAHAETRRLVPPEQRLEYSPEQGWGPLCEFLGVEKPAEDVKFPLVNDSGSFHIKMGVVKRHAVGRIVRRWLPILVLIGAVGAAWRWGRI
ncbi:hypothetical protein MMC28_006935 [Mycoblastus sanguinarius]|nr:hypothetical protein [Mycoblastus sanguinarius]